VELVVLVLTTLVLQTVAVVEELFLMAQTPLPEPLTLVVVVVEEPETQTGPPQQTQRQVDPVLLSFATQQTEPLHSAQD
jgi:hypothetical protein